MPPAKDNMHKQSSHKLFLNGGLANSARVYHPATNLMPPSPPVSPTGQASSFGDRNNSSNSFSRQNSQTSTK